MSSETSGIVSHAYDTAGTYLATLRVGDDKGNKATDYVSVSIS